MQNFTYYIPTKVHFGKGQIEKLGESVLEYGRKALLVYGGGSIKKSGLYDKIVSIFKDKGIDYVELSGVEPNPRVYSVREGVKICRENNVEVIVPVGGGSCIDCAKAIASAVFYDGDYWDIVLDATKCEKALPIVTVLTLAATGSEMDCGAVITNPELNDKTGLRVGEKLRPKISIMDPEYTFSVPAYHTAAGAADIMAHALEMYFKIVPGTYFQRRMVEGLVKTVIYSGKKAIENPNDYDARANLMWCSSWAINGFLGAGNAGPWIMHPMEHVLSAYYDITHGVGLAVLMPRFMKKVMKKPNGLDVLYEYGTNIWEIDKKLTKEEVANQAIKMTYDYFISLGIPMTLKEAGIYEKDKLEEMAEKASLRTGAAYFSLSKDEVLEIFEECYE